MKDGLFFGGVTTKPEVRRLMEAFPLESLEPGFQIPYGEITKIIGAEPRSNRFRTVTNSWRKLLRSEHSIIVDPSSHFSGVFEVLNDSKKVAKVGKKIKSSVKMVREAVFVAGTVDVHKLTHDEKKTHDFYAQRSAAILTMGLIKCKVPLPKM